ncbi:hypothetical protein GUJ93_ZPchr0002g26069 [Zizania palustris]|uniref:ABC1 atypical kinase-like domain-containing protein n=1 Tax=Zizania palustris TaxID=103762 RepID=A0A8J5RJU5_ZIZPA|nr:hypothetical protein GUJ93_ZPchr0002g26069 [Zizania palustris]
MGRAGLRGCRRGGIGEREEKGEGDVAKMAKLLIVTQGDDWRPNVKDCCLLTNFGLFGIFDGHEGDGSATAANSQMARCLFGKLELAISCFYIFYLCLRSFIDTTIYPFLTGQVHRACLNGKEVVIKVQRPGLKGLFDIDLKNLR